jgi:putative nucleotidyltransferase with HDIG domain
MQTEYIASGDQYIVSGEHKILKALLGSCVGVAIYDQESRVGGLIHLLLPEPASLGSSWSPGSYVTSGLPLFIDNLLQAGAKPKNLVAVIAGGALFGRISQHDIALNIGGRCVEKVHAILQERHIPIIKEESCGFSAAILTLDTTGWQSEITTRFEAPAPAHELRRPSREEVLGALWNIAPIPQNSLKIIHLLSDGDYEADEIVHIVETDQVLAAKILSLCNSALFMPREAIDSLNDAVVLLGSGHLLQMVVTATVDSLLGDHQDGYAMLKGGLYKHALGVAHAARVIAHDGGRVDPGVAYTAGLLHDIGKIGLDRHFASFRPLFYQNHGPADDDLIDMEHDLLGIDHQTVGMLLASEWGLPESIAQAIGHHHAPELAQSHPELVHLVYLADLLTSWYLAGMEFERINTDALHTRLHFLGLTARQLPGLIERVPWKTIMYL